MFDEVEEPDDTGDDPVAARVPRPRRPGMLLAVGAVTLIGALILGGAALLRHDDGPATPRLSWGELLIADRLTGSIARVTVDGTVNAATVLPSFSGIDELSAGEGLIAVRSGVDLFIDPFDTEPQRIAVPPGFATRLIPSADRATILIGSEGDDLTVIGATAEIVAGTSVRSLAQLTAEPTPRYPLPDIRVDPLGHRLAIPDATNFQTVVLNLAAETVTYFPDLPLAVRDDLVVTAQRVGDRMELGMFASSGERLRTVPTEVIVGGAIPPGASRFVFVTRSGQVWSARPSKGDAERIGTAAISTQITSVRPGLDGRRLVVNADDAVVVVDSDGNTIVRRDTPGATSEGVSMPNRCVTIRLGSSIELIDLDDGDLIASATDVDITGRSLDGCLVAALGPTGAVLIGEGGISPVDGSVVALAPDSTAVVVNSSGRLRLIDYDQGLGDAVDLDVSGDLAEFIPS